MRIQIIGLNGSDKHSGIYNSSGEEIAPGAILDVSEEPAAWKGRYTVLGKTEGKAPATGKEKPPEDPARAVLEKLGVDDLKKLADDEKIDLKGASAKGDMIDHILKARADKA